MVQEMLLKDISYLHLWWPSCLTMLTEQNHLGNFRGGHYEEHFCEIILNLDEWFRRCRFKIFLSRARAAILSGGAKPFGQFWQMAL